MSFIQAIQRFRKEYECKNTDQKGHYSKRIVVAKEAIHKRQRNQRILPCSEIREVFTTTEERRELIPPYLEMLNSIPGRTSIKMAASALVGGRPPSSSPNSSSMELFNVLRGLASCSKGRLTYDTEWKATKQALDECTKPPLLSSNLSTVSPSSNVGEKSCILSTNAVEDKSKDKIRHSDDFPISSSASSVESDLEDESSERVGNEELYVLEKELQASFDNTHVAIHQYEIEKKHQAGERLNSRKEKFSENSKKLLETKNHYLRQKENERLDEVIKSVQALQEDEQRKSEEVRLRQQKLEQSHKEYKERAARKIKEVEELLRQEQQIKKELQQLEVSYHIVKETALKIQQTFQGCKFQSLLSPSVSEIQSEVNKVLKVSQNSLDVAHENGQASEVNVKIIQDCSALIQSLFQKAKTLVHEANSKAARQEAERQAKEETRAKEEAKAKEEEEKRQQALKASKANQPSTVATSDSKEQPKTGISKELSSCISAIAWKEYSRLANYKSEIVESAEPLNTDKSLKQYKFDLHKAVTTPINAISDQSPSHLLDKIQRLTKLLSGQSVQVGGKQISISKHPAAKPFCKELLARKLVQQGSQQVSSSHSSAFPIAAVITGMWSSFPDVGDLILAQFYDQCPFLVPFYIPRAAELSDAEYFASLGYQCSEGEIEEQDKFLKRMTALVRLYEAVISSIPPSGQPKEHPYGLGNGWTWLSRMLNLEPRPDYTATALYEFLAVAGHALMRKYKKQFGKLLNTLVLNYVPKIEKVTNKAQSGPVVRLKVFLEACIKDQKIPVPDGYLTPRWWNSPSF